MILAAAHGRSILVAPRSFLGVDLVRFLLQVAGNLDQHVPVVRMAGIGGKLPAFGGAPAEAFCFS